MGLETDMWGWEQGHGVGNGDVGLGTSWDVSDQGGSGLVPQWDLSWMPAAIWVESRLDPEWDLG